ncbi:MAG: DUF177 domain-containing protein [Clostridia bacterium]|nr:DUF177 domain-containing protein [Clostridia bacterium]
MELQIANALRMVSESFPFVIEETVQPQLYGERTVSFAEPLRVEGTYVFDGKAITVTATVTTVLNSVCARCAEPFREPFSFGMEERFVRDAILTEDDDEEIYPYESDRLLLDKAVMDNLYLQLPSVSVCREDCKGLCPVCGIDRNKGICTCEQGEPEGPFAVLSKIKF